MDPLVSIIVPVYNVKPYLNRCVDSLLGQSYQNTELLLVDDGSTDGSETLCDEYAAQDARVRVLHKKNGGLSDARNAGVDAAAGEYLSFVDGDDWVSPYYIENLYRALEQAGADFSASCFEEVFEGQPVQSVPTERLEAFEILSREECLVHKVIIEKFLKEELNLELSKWTIQKVRRGMCSEAGREEFVIVDSPDRPIADYWNSFL